MPEVRIVKAEPGLVGGLDGESWEATERLLNAALHSAELPRPGSRVTVLDGRNGDTSHGLVFDHIKIYNSFLPHLNGLVPASVEKEPLEVGEEEHAVAGLAGAGGSPQAVHVLILVTWHADLRANSSSECQHFTFESGNSLLRASRI